MTDFTNSQTPGVKGRGGVPASYRVAVVPGDGIGPEVIGEAIKVLDAAAKSEGFGIEWTEFDLGADRYLTGGEILPDSELEVLAGHDAILLGAVGDPRVEPGVLEIGLLLRLRQELDLYVNLRPARLFEGVPGPLEGVPVTDVDLVIVRENTEGLYSRQGEVVRAGTQQETATEMSVNTAGSVERIVRYAFQVASGQSRPLTLVHKANVLERAGALYRRVFESVAEEYPRVATEYQHVDAAALLLVTDPSRFSVIVTDNLFGDILSDLTAALAGGIGFVGSGNIHPGRVSLFEPVHGSAPDIAGTGRANPIGAILSAAMLLRHVGENSAADRIENAVSMVAGKAATSDLATTEVGDLIAGVIS